MDLKRVRVRGISLEKAGWRREGDLKRAVVKEGRVADLSVYGVTREEARTLPSGGLAE